MSTDTSINLVIALQCEAKPLIEFYKLRKITHLNLPFSLFVNKEKNIHLIISGIGKIKMAAATTYLSIFTGSKRFSCFLNIGIAGSTQFPIGEFVLAHKIIEHNARKNCWYPFIPLKNKNQTQLFTYDHPQLDYPEKGMVDMEGAAFFQIASLYVTHEQILVAKVISDHDEVSRQQINESSVQKIISNNMQNIAHLVDYLRTLSHQESNFLCDPNCFSEFQSAWYFTHAELLQLKESLRRWQAHITDQNPLRACQNEKSAQQVIKKLNAALNIDAGIKDQGRTTFDVSVNMDT